MLKINTAKLLQSEMDRKTFLKNTGIAFVGIIGVTSIVKNINGFAEQKSDKAPVRAQFGYGGSAYGGRLNTGR